MSSSTATVRLVAGAAAAAGAILLVGVPAWNRMWDAVWGAHKDGPTSTPAPEPAA